MSDEDEITRPGTPDALRDMREMQRTLRVVLSRLDAIVTTLERVEVALAKDRRETGEALSEARKAFERAKEAASMARFSDKRIDVLVSRIQRVESGQR